MGAGQPPLINTAANTAKKPSKDRLFCCAALCGKATKKEHPNGNLIKISNNPDRSIGGLDYFCKKIKKHLTI